ncbi:PTS sugar transporter subunit IIA [Weizmannia acidilactici]|uniref:PTS sugar transporter subunit IIA n=1 Tax=Weizmannia acidilactici TaxID=2607726 RepID=UPI00124E9DFF|nr:PTS sugar transporter subunit IIA [Weizmannia acidilactici]GER73544.1 PTS fructose transporter subunit IIA [Weizmannia acidilactici]
MQYILAAHGKYAIETKNSCQMITGNNENIHAVGFTETMGINDVLLQFENIIQEYRDDEFTIIVDIPGGTPCNAAIIASQKYSNIIVATGLSLAMVIPLSLGESLSQVMDEVKDFCKIVVSKDNKLISTIGEEEN